MTSTSPFFRAAELPLSRPNGQSRLRQFEAVGLSLHVPWPASRSAHFSLGQHYVTQSQAWCIQNRLGVSQPSPSHLHNHVDSYRPCHLQVCIFWKALLALNVILISGFCTVTSKDDAVLFRFVQKQIPQGPVIILTPVLFYMKIYVNYHTYMHIEKLHKHVQVINPIL